MAELWLCGKWEDQKSYEDKDDGVIWAFMGIFDNKEKAIEACRDEFYFISPVLLNRVLPEFHEVFPKIEWPKR